MTTSSHELASAWREAITFEHKMRERYLFLAQAASDPSVKSLFEYLAGEELKHEQMLQDEYGRAFESDM